VELARKLLAEKAKDAKKGLFLGPGPALFAGGDLKTTEEAMLASKLGNFTMGDFVLRVHLYQARGLQAVDRCMCTCAWRQ
jgi:hypothetical protein